MYVYEAHMTGQVQGVGFRPYIYKKAIELGLKGWVCNDVDGVHIRFKAKNKETANQIVSDWLKHAPAMSRIRETFLTAKPDEEFSDFHIALSQVSHNVTQGPCPDFAICPECLNEMLDSSDRRFQYPFITCTNCGPRFSIMEKVPYDRPLTSMKIFKQCNPCHTEYWNPLHRRFFSQTNSCGACGIQMKLIDRENIEISNNSSEIPGLIAELLTKGAIIAVKGVGGFLLLADATNVQAITQLRKRKKRPKKPFALMYPDLDIMQGDLQIEAKSADLLQSSICPIILLKTKDHISTQIQRQLIAPGLDKLGVMLPYTGLFHLIFKNIKQPIIATSANITNEPIVYQNNEAISKLFHIADYLVIHDRPIIFPQDDSVYNASNLASPIVIRRSRGLAPTLDQPQGIKADKTILAFGAQLKSSFALYHLGKLYTSPYLGNQEYFETRQRFEHFGRTFLELMQAKPQQVLVDAHPDYASTRLGESWAQELNIPINYIFHHKAHFAAVLAEHHIDRKDRVLGVVWDGTGFGEDQHIWGGEFFSLDNCKIQRINHFGYFDHLMGDQMAKKPAVSALSLVQHSDALDRWLRKKFKSKEWPVYQQINKRNHSLKTSSVGRIFDAVSSLLNLTDHNSYEGEAAMLLEVVARKWMEHKQLPNSHYLSEWTGEGSVPTYQLINEIITDLEAGKQVSYIGAKFHCSLVNLIQILANKTQFKQIAFSGGVFQNSLIVELIHQMLGDQFILYFHRELSPNDECISYGQIAHHCYYGKNEEPYSDPIHSTKLITSCV